MEPTEQPETTPRPNPTEPDPGEPAAGELDLDAIERDLDDVERTLDRLADGTYWSTGEQSAERPDAPA